MISPDKHLTTTEERNQHQNEDSHSDVTNNFSKTSFPKGSEGSMDMSNLNENDKDKLSKLHSASNKASSNGQNTVYESKWASSQMNKGTEISLEIDEEFDEHQIDLEMSDGELPIFANEECRRLHQLTKQLEIERDEAAKEVRENRDRISIMRDHLSDVRQEIDSTNALFAAKTKEIATEKHLIAMDERERAAIVAEMKVTDTTITKEKERLRAIQNQIHILIDEREKLKLDLNWNQEELEQWATAAAKKDGDAFALEKYTRADEVKIKELTLKLENMTKKSVNKKAELENEIAENQAKKLEVERLAKTFKEQHEERRLLVNQWQETVNAMKDRDSKLNDLSNTYIDVQQELDIQRSILAEKKESLEILKVGCIKPVLSKSL